MKKIIAFILVVLTCALSLSGCKQEQSDDKIKVVCTSFAAFSWTTEIIGDTQNVEVNYLLESGVDIHSFKPSVKDFAALSDSDLLILVGIQSDLFSLESVGTKTQVVNMFDELKDTVKHEEITEGMDHEDDHSHSNLDEHVWLSINNAKTICKVIAQKLAALDVENAENYNVNLNMYLEKLDKLDNKFKETVANAKHNTLIFADRFPFRYLLDDYGINYFAAFPGCSTDTDASFKTVIFLANKIDSLSLNTVLTTENYTHKIPQTVIENTANKNAQVLSMNAMQSVAIDEKKSFLPSYVDIMEGNLSVIQTALN